MADTDELPEEEIAKRRDEALRRALNTPPQPRKKPDKPKPSRKPSGGKAKSVEPSA